jgi:hypothetical protein
MNIRDITEGPGWDAVKSGFKSGAGPGMKAAIGNLKTVANPNNLGDKPVSGADGAIGAAWNKHKPGGDDSGGGDDKTPSKEPNQNLEYLKQQSAIMKDKKLTPEQKLEKLDQLLQQQIQQGGR